MQRFLMPRKLLGSLVKIRLISSNDSSIISSGVDEINHELNLLWGNINSDEPLNSQFESNRQQSLESFNATSLNVASQIKFDNHISSPNQFHGISNVDHLSASVLVSSLFVESKDEFDKNNRSIDVKYVEGCNKTKIIDLMVKNIAEQLRTNPLERPKNIIVLDSWDLAMFNNDRDLDLLNICSSSSDLTLVILMKPIDSANVSFENRDSETASYSWIDSFQQISSRTNCKIVMIREKVSCINNLSSILGFVTTKGAFK